MEEDPRRRITDLATARGVLRRPSGKTTTVLSLPSRAIQEHGRSPVREGLPGRMPSGSLASAAALVLFLVGAGLLSARFLRGRQAPPLVALEPVVETTPPSAPVFRQDSGFPESPAARADWPAWVRSLEDQANRATRDGQHARAERLRRRALEVLGLIESPGDELAAARIGLQLSLAHDPMTGDAHRIWLERARREISELEATGAARNLVEPFAERLGELARLRAVPGGGGIPSRPGRRRRWCAGRSGASASTRSPSICCHTW